MQFVLEFVLFRENPEQTATLLIRRFKRLSSRRLEHQRQRFVQLFGGKQQSPVGGFAVFIWRDHVRWTHHGRLGQKTVHIVFGRVDASGFGINAASRGVFWF